jgi:methionyl-tRNA synthetase
LLTFDEFKRVQLRVARVISAERVTGTDKLLRLMIDLGGEQRQIVAGIGRAYEPADLVGRAIVVVANLQPAKIRGTESNGMLLAAVDGDRVALVVPDAEVSPGSEVS